MDVRGYLGSNARGFSGALTHWLAIPADLT
jgi:hypothetical protein